jgi:hypothetical protein
MIDSQRDGYQPPQRIRDTSASQANQSSTATQSARLALSASSLASSTS